MFTRGAYFCPPPAFCPEMDAKEWLKKLEDFFRASGVPTTNYGATGRCLLTDPVRCELDPAGQATDDSFEELKERLMNAYGLEESPGMLIDRFHALHQREDQSIQQFRHETRSCGTFPRLDYVVRSLSGDPAAGAADPRRSSEAGQQDNPGGRRLPGEIAAARRHREAREDRGGPADRRHDKRDGQPGQESRAAGTNDATTLQDCTRMLPLWQLGPPPARLSPATDPNPASAYPEQRK
ncbi:hypothetical protein T07_9836 [Trichinella nelsoni]|uniref:Retrotransposon gag domain-containing protein n=1 Tax=Trichinella nelsoni TaxID=6336 RepID=A0A0V0S457_9BILA|nr:hypothetical protein T07_9836 [Trichinella nelsoni]